MFFGVSAVPQYAYAQLGLDQAKQAAGDAGLETSDEKSNLTLIVVRLIRNAFGLLGITGVVLFVYAGFLWMTAGGDSGKVDQAKTLIRQTVIGMIIILAAFAITQFVLGALVSSVS